MASDLERLDRQRREALARAEDAEARLSAVLALCDQTGGGPDAWLYVVDVLAAVRGECDRPAAFSISDADDGHPVISYSGEGDRPADVRAAAAGDDRG